MKNIVFDHVVKAYDKNVIVKDLNMEIREGERLILLGPSGCGKSTTLRMIAGLEKLSGGNLYMDGRLVNDVPCGERNVSMVFQNYALFPHMTVQSNIVYGLKAHKMDPAEIKTRLSEVLDMLDLKGLEERRPKDLSGGQRQRVALARAVVKRSDYFLLDEPLSNLDAQLRLRARKELVKIHEMYHQTLIYVTHDQIEAMTVGQRIALMHEGKMQMLDTPANVYNRPANVFTAKFIGSPSMNIVEASYTGNAGDRQTGGLAAGHVVRIGLPQRIRPSVPGNTPGAHDFAPQAPGKYPGGNRQVRGGLRQPVRRICAGGQYGNYCCKRGGCPCSGRERIYPAGF